MSNKFNIVSFLARWLFAAALVFGTYNPSDFSYANWALADTTEFGPIPALVGVALLIAWIVFLRATFMSLGWLILSAASGAVGGYVLRIRQEKGKLLLQQKDKGTAQQINGMPNKPKRLQRTKPP